jgi:DnaJ-class molecular chaperone
MQRAAQDRFFFSDLQNGCCLPHELYTREGNDLLAHRKIDLVDALAGTAVSLKTLDGRDLVVKLTDAW